MKQSQLFGTTRKSVGQEEIAKNAILLQRGGYIHRTMAGVYVYLPLGWRILQRITAIVREELNKLPATQELLMPAMQPLSLWEETGRREEYRDIMYEVANEQVGLGPTHEEIVTDLFRHMVHSYRELPVAVYQIQTKFRKELRAKSGLLRGREFLMKDLYSFHLTEESLDEYYKQAQQAYAAIYERCGLRAILTEASGGTFSKYSHEYQVVNPAGEDDIFLNIDGTYARNKEIVPDENDPELIHFGGGTVTKVQATEVGNIFKLNRRFSEALDAAVLDDQGNRVQAWMGCYGIGISRLLGVVTEIYGDEKGSIKWPENLAPYKVHILDLTADRQGVALYETLGNSRDDVLVDDRGRSAGEQFNDADLIGAPYRVIVSPRSLEKGGAEVKTVETGETRIISLDQLSAFIAEKLA